MLRFARVWLLLAVPFYFLARTELVEEWIPFAWTLFYVFVGFGIISLLLSLFEDAPAKVPATAVNPAPARVMDRHFATNATAPAPVVALALGVSAVALASSAQLEIPPHNPAPETGSSLG